MKILKPYRERIDSIDARLIALLRERYDVIEAVGDIKKQHGIESVLQDRIDEVRNNAAAMAREHDLDADFIYRLWTQIIDHSCALEDTIKETPS